VVAADDLGLRIERIADQSAIADRKLIRNPLDPGSEIVGIHREQ
jgi:hypothetical protein